MTESSDLRDLATKCRRLSRSASDALTQTRLLELAAEYDARALAIEIQPKSELP
jgi:hypothetical protein